MKKTKLVLAIVCVSLASMGSCGKDEDNVTKDEQCGLLKINKNEFVTMQVSPENVPVGSDNVVLIVTNNTSKEITYSIYFTLDYFDGTNWMPIELDIAFEDLLLAVPAGKSIEKEIFLWPEYHDYKIGKYRITKEFPINNERRNICAEFEITP